MYQNALSDVAAMVQPLIAMFCPVQLANCGCPKGKVPQTGMALPGVMPGREQGCANALNTEKQERITRKVSLFMIIQRYRDLN